jgi:hypothetical protein
MSFQQSAPGNAEKASRLIHRHGLGVPEPQRWAEPYNAYAIGP